MPVFEELKQMLAKNGLLAFLRNHDLKMDRHMDTWMDIFRRCFLSFSINIHKKSWNSILSHCYPEYIGKKCSPSPTMSITIFRRESFCFLLRFWKMSQFSSCSSLKPTARWWFSSTDESLYISANSEPKRRKEEIITI